MADRPGAAKVKVKSFDEIMAEKRQRALQNKGERKQDGENTKAVTQLRNKKREAAKSSTGTEKPKLCLLSHVDTGFVRVMENLEGHGIQLFQFPGLESYGI